MYLTRVTPQVGATTGGRYRVSVCKKNLEVTSAFVAIGESGGVEALTLSLPTSTTCDGVLRVTVPTARTRTSTDLLLTKQMA